MKGVVLAALAAITVLGLAACGSSEAGGTATLPPSSVAVTTVPSATTVPVTTSLPTATEPAVRASTDAPDATTGDEVVVTDADVADMEKELDDIDQLLSGVDADLSQD